MDRELLELIGAVCAVDESSGVPPSFYVMEECAELIKEIMKDQRGKGDREKIVDEACDVLTTVAVLLHKYGVTPQEAQDRMGFKCRRAVERWETSKEA